MKVLFYSVVENLLVEVWHRALSPIMPDAGTYLRICHLNSPFEATFQLLKMFADQDRVPQDSVSQDSSPQDSVPQGTEPQVIVTLTEADIPGALHALLNEPLEAHNVAALKWWLLCHDIKLPSSCRKRQLIQHQQHNGHDELTVSNIGFHVSRSHSFLGASPDGGV